MRSPRTRRAVCTASDGAAAADPPGTAPPPNSRESRPPSPWPRDNARTGPRPCRRTASPAREKRRPSEGRSRQIFRQTRGQLPDGGLVHQGTVVSRDLPDRHAAQGQRSPAEGLVIPRLLFGGAIEGETAVEGAGRIALQGAHVRREDPAEVVQVSNVEGERPEQARPLPAQGIGIE